MNQNQQNQLPIQNGLNALIGYLQPQLQGQAQQGGPAPMQTFPQFQQQPQAVLWPGWQPQTNIGALGGTQYVQQWAAQPMAQQQQPVAAPGAPQPPSANEIAMAVAAIMQPLLQEKNASPVGSKPDDEKILIDALKKARADGLTPRQALEKLHNVNDHTETGWKNYFLDHFEKLYAKVYHDARPPVSVPYVEVPLGPSASRRHEGPSSASARKDSSRSPGPSRHNLAIPRTRAKSRELPPQLPRRRIVNASPPASKAAAAIRESELLLSPSSAARSRRGDPVADYHAGTHIPPVAVYSKPKAPRRDPEGNRFTDDDKVYFIHYLRWRLQREGPLPTRSDLYAELAEQTPHRDADAWKRHWDDHPQLPDRILIEARNRNKDDDQTMYTAARSIVARDEDSADDEDGGNDDSEDEDEDKDEEDEEDEPEDGDEENVDGEGPSTERYANDVHAHGALVKKQRKKPRKAVVRLKVTECDLRAMAQYMAERDAVWDSYPSHSACWKEFANNNTKRSLSAWISVSLKREKVIEQYAREYLRGLEEERNPPASSPPPLSRTTTGNSAFHLQATDFYKLELNVMGHASTPRKRSIETIPMERNPSSTQKRVKREEPEYIDLTSD